MKECVCTLIVVLGLSTLAGSQSRPSYEFYQTEEPRGSYVYPKAVAMTTLEINGSYRQILALTEDGTVWTSRQGYEWKAYGNIFYENTTVPEWSSSAWEGQEYGRIPVDK